MSRIAKNLIELIGNTPCWKFQIIVKQKVFNDC